MASRAVRRRMDDGVYWQDAPEYKLIDVNASTDDVQPTGVWQLLNGVSTGTDYQLRVGRKIQCKSVSLRGCVYPTAGAAFVPQRWDQYVIYDTQSNGTTPTTTEFLETATALSFRNLNNRSRFVVLAHMCGFMGASTNVPLAPGGEAVDVHCEVDLETIFNGTGGTVASIASGSIYLLTISGSAGGAGTGFDLDMHCRVRFTDS